MVVNSYTKLIRLADHAYPRYTRDMAVEFPNVGFPSVWADSEGPKLFGYDYVIPTPAPEGDVVEDGVPVFHDDDQHWYQTWTSRSFTPEEIAQTLINIKAVNIAIAQDVVNAQFQMTITSVTHNGKEYGVYLRPEDITTLLAVKVLAADGTVTEPFTLRLFQGTLTGTAVEVTGLINAVLVMYYGIQNRAWEYMALVDQATTLEEIPQCPTSFLN